MNHQGLSSRVTRVVGLAVAGSIFGSLLAVATPVTNAQAVGAGDTDLSALLDGGSLSDLPTLEAMTSAAAEGGPSAQGPLEAGVEPGFDSDGNVGRITGAGLPSGQSYLLYTVALNGTSQGVAFRTQGNLVVTSAIDRSATRNGVNGLDIFLITGNPYLPNASAGTISYATNSGFDELRSGRNPSARLDGAYVSYNSGTRIADVRPDPGVAAALSLNNFTGRGGLFGDVYLVKDGRMLIQFSADSRNVTGVADLTGTGYLYHSNTPYRAQMTGSFVGQGKFR